MLVVANDAEAEAVRLSEQGTQIAASPMTRELLEKVSGIDGSILIDTKGICYAIGVILDGEAKSECSSARGSRYNSAVRYVGSKPAKRMAIVVSDDHTVDLLPLLMPQVSRAEIESHIAALEKASLNDYHRPRFWLDEHRYYFDNEQCERINAAWNRIEQMPLELSQLRVSLREFTPNLDIEKTAII